MATASKASEAAKASEVEAPTEHIVEDVVQVEVAEATEATTAGRTAVHAGETVFVIARFLVGVTQNGIGLRGFLESFLGGFFLGVGAVHPLVGVPFQGSLR